MNMITGYIASTEGTVKIDGHDILEEPEAAKKCIGYLPELPPLYMDMTVKEYLYFMYELKKAKLAPDTRVYLSWGEKEGKGKHQLAQYTANALADSLMSRYTPENTEIIDINNLKERKQKLKFTKMSACSNDYIYINLFDKENTVSSPEFLSIFLSDRRGRRRRHPHLPQRRGRRSDAHVQPGRQRGQNVRQRHPLRGKVRL